MTVRVLLTEQELEYAAMIGAKRYYESVTHGRKDNAAVSQHESGLWLHIAGACGEIAVAKWAGQYWGGDIGTFKAADVGSRVQVRTRTKLNGELIVREKDNADHAYVLVTGVGPELFLQGWCWGHEAKQPEYWKAYGGKPPAYFVPNEKLRPMHLPQTVRDRATVE